MYAKVSVVVCVCVCVWVHRYFFPFLSSFPVPLSYKSIHFCCVLVSRRLVSHSNFVSSTFRFTCHFWMALTSLTTFFPCLFSSLSWACCCQVTSYAIWEQSLKEIVRQLKQLHSSITHALVVPEHHVSFFLYVYSHLLLVCFFAGLFVCFFVGFFLCLCLSFSDRSCFTCFVLVIGWMCGTNYNHFHRVKRSFFSSVRVVQLMLLVIPITNVYTVCFVCLFACFFLWSWFYQLWEWDHRCRIIVAYGIEKEVSHSAGFMG